MQQKIVLQVQPTGAEVTQQCARMVMKSVDVTEMQAALLAHFRLGAKRPITNNASITRVVDVQVEVGGRLHEFFVEGCFLRIREKPIPEAF